MSVSNAEIYVASGCSDVLRNSLPALRRFGGCLSMLSAMLGWELEAAAVWKVETTAAMVVDCCPATSRRCGEAVL